MENNKKTTQVKKASTKKNTTKNVQVKKTTVKKNIKKSKKAFTLIELLAVIIILGVLMIIAIPSVTRYIQDSRDSSYITTAQSFIDSARVMANSGELSMYDPDTTYYIPKDCIGLEKGGDSPYGEFTDAYVVVTYNGKGFDYYWTSNDVTGHGIYLAYGEDLNTDLIVTSMEDVDTTIGVGDRSKVIIFDDSCSTILSSESVTNSIPENGIGSSDTYVKPDYSNYLRKMNSDDPFSGASFSKASVESLYTLRTNVVPTTGTVAFGSIPTSGIDVSQQQNGSIMLWAKDEDNDGMYELYLGQKGGVTTNPNSQYLFQGFTNATYFDLSNMNTKNTTSMYRMFNWSINNSPTFKIVGMDKWDVSNVTNMSDMFKYCGENASSWDIGDLSKWNVSKVTNLGSMFYYAGRKASHWYIGDISNWDVSKVTTMNYMFGYVASNDTNWNIGNLSKWNVSSVKDLACMFYSAATRSSTWNIGDLSKWNVSNVTNMWGMFNGAGSSAKKFDIGDLSNWDTSKVTDMERMFSGTASSATEKVDPNVSGWNVSKVTSYNNFNYSATWITPPTWVN